MTTSGYFLTRSTSVEVDWQPSSSAERATPLNSILSIRSSSVGKILLCAIWPPLSAVSANASNNAQMIDFQLRTLLRQCASSRSSWDDHGPMRDGAGERQYHHQRPVIQGNPQPA